MLGAWIFEAKIKENFMNIQCKFEIAAGTEFLLTICPIFYHIFGGFCLPKPLRERPRNLQKSYRNLLVTPRRSRTLPNGPRTFHPTPGPELGPHECPGPGESGYI